MPKLISPRVRARYINLRKEGFSRSAAARECGVSYNWACSVDDGLRNSSNDNATQRAARKGGEEAPQPFHPHELSPVARDCLEDFERFRVRYLGHTSTPWQVETAQQVVLLLASPDKEFVVENCPPGVGKTTLIHDIAAWLTCRDRRMRGLFGSRTELNARRQLRRLKRTLERTHPVQAPSELLDRGLAVDGEATLAMDYGTFRPFTSDVWRSDEFVVAQVEERAVEEKEPTWSSYGMDSGVLGNRFNFIAWDDVVDRKTLRTSEAVESQREWWDTEAETRLEPHGLLWLVGQRLGSEDLYRWCLNKTVAPDDDDDLGGTDVAEGVEDDGLDRQYRHIIYRAHYEELCSEGSHRRDADPWPNGCLLDPYRLPWREISTLRQSRQRFEVVYQQQDVDPERQLVQAIWVSGGKGADGVQYPGCWDPERRLGEVPPGLAGPLLSIVSVDPSATRYWGIQWWLVQRSTELRYLIDLIRRPMEANEFLDWSATTAQFSGVMEDWWLRSSAQKAPITHLIIEANAAHRYLLAYDHIRRWQRQRRVLILPHSTQRNKADPDLGVEALIPSVWKHGQVRLPGSQGRDGIGAASRFTSLKLVEEVQRWTPGRKGSTDQVMAQWFLELNLPNISHVKAEQKRGLRPSWLMREPA